MSANKIKLYKSSFSRFLFNFALEYTIRRILVKQDDLNLNGTHQLLAYADDVNILVGSAHTVKKNTKSLVVASNEIGLEVNADKAMYVVIPRDQNAGRSHKSHNIKTDNSSFESVEEFKYLGKILTNQNTSSINPFFMFVQLLTFFLISVFRKLENKINF